MKKVFAYVMLTLLCFLLTSCSEESKAKRIYNNNKLTDKEKMDQLIALYGTSRKSNDKYNDRIEDAAWDAITRGDYDVAVGLLDSSKGSSGGYYALEYLQKLQFELPEPTTLYIEIVTRYDGELKWKWGFDYPEIRVGNESGFDPGVYYEIDLNVINGKIYSYDTGEHTDHTMNWGNELKKNSNGQYQDFELDITFSPYPGTQLSYYKKTTYEYSFSITNLDVSKVGTYYIVGGK